MGNSVISPRGKYQSLKISDAPLTKAAANPHLVFAAFKDLYYPGPKVSTGSETYKFFAGYRLTQDMISDGIYSLGTSPELEAYRSAREDLTQKRELAFGHTEFERDSKDNIIGVKPYTKHQDHLMAEYRQAAKNYPPVPAIPLTIEPRLLPRGSLLLCQSVETEYDYDADNFSDTWFSLTPDEQKTENLLRCGGVVLFNGQSAILEQCKFSTIWAGGCGEISVFMKNWPEANRVAHRDDMSIVDSLRHRKEPEPQTRRYTWFDRVLNR